MGQLYRFDGSPLKYPNDSASFVVDLPTPNSIAIAQNKNLSTVTSPYRQKIIDTVAINAAQYKNVLGVSNLSTHNLAGWSNLSTRQTIGLRLASSVGLSSFLNPPPIGSPTPHVLSLNVVCQWNNSNAWSGVTLLGGRCSWPNPIAIPGDGGTYFQQPYNYFPDFDFSSPLPGVFNDGFPYYGLFKLSSTGSSLFPDLDIQNLLVGVNCVLIPTGLPLNLWCPYPAGFESYQAPICFLAYGVRIVEVADLSQPTLEVLAQSPFFYPGDPNGLQFIDGGDIVTAYGSGSSPVFPPPVNLNGITVNYTQGPFLNNLNMNFSAFGAGWRFVDLPASLLNQRDSLGNALSDGLYGWAGSLTNTLSGSVSVNFDPYTPSWFASGYFSKFATPYICSIQSKPDPSVQRPTLIQQTSPQAPLILSPNIYGNYTSISGSFLGRISPATGPINPNFGTPMWRSTVDKGYRIYPSGRLVQNKVFLSDPITGRVFTGSNPDGSVKVITNTIRVGFGIQGSFARPICEIPMTGKKTYKLYLAT